MKKIFTITLLVCVALSANSQSGKRIYKKFTDSTFNVGDIIMAPELLFSVSSCEVLRSSLDSVNIIAGFIKKHPSFTIEIGIFTDSRGDWEKNIKLSLCRANSVKDYLYKELMLPENKIVAKGYGKAEPIISEAEINKFSAKTEEGRKKREELHQKNRRVELKILALN